MGPSFLIEYIAPFLDGYASEHDIALTISQFLVASHDQTMPFSDDAFSNIMPTILIPKIFLTIIHASLII